MKQAQPSYWEIQSQPPPVVPKVNSLKHMQILYFLSFPIVSNMLQGQCHRTNNQGARKESEAGYLGSIPGT